MSRIDSIELNESQYEEKREEERGRKEKASRLTWLSSSISSDSAGY